MDSIYANTFIIFLASLIILNIFLALYLYRLSKFIKKEKLQRNQEKQSQEQLNALSHELVDQMEYEIALRVHSEELLEYVFENTPNIVMLIESESLKIKRYNPASRAIFNEITLNNGNFLDLLESNENKKLAHRELTNAKNNGGRVNFTIEINRSISKYNNDFEIESQSSVLHNQNNDKISHLMVIAILFDSPKQNFIYITAVDITKNIELNHKIDNARAMLSQLSKQESMGQMLGNIAHQWRQPLNSLYLLVQNLAQISPNEPDYEENFSKSIKTMKAQIEFMDKTIDEFAKFYHSKNNNSIFLPCAAIARLLDLFYKVQKNKVKINLQVSYAKSNINHEELENKEEYEFKFLAGVNEFQQIIMVLLDNALDELARKKAQTPNFAGSVDIFCEKINIKDSMLCVNSLAALNKEEPLFALRVRVLDNGDGIKQENFENIFKTHWSSKPNGSGIGLSILLLILEKFGGKIAFKNLTNSIESNSDSMPQSPKNTTDSIDLSKNIESDFKQNKQIFGAEFYFDIPLYAP